jgi:uncharacterized protein (TIGR00730 family)
MKRVCVFLGSSPGSDPRYAQTAVELGRELAARDLELVYGAGSVGLMGVLADAALAAGGRVTGVIPERLIAREAGHSTLSELHVVATMHARKAKMAELADAFVAMPGGLGTLEEFFEALTWAQLGYHNKPIGLLQVQGYFERLLEFLDHTVTSGFVAARHRQLFIVEDSVPALLDALRDAAPAAAGFDDSMI